MNFKRSNQRETQPILESIRLIVRALRVSSRASERDLGLSSAQLYVLQKLSDSAGISLNELAARTLTHQSSVSVVVAKLCEQAFVQKKPSPDDERKLEISITPKGRALIKQAPEPFQQRLIKAIQSMPPRQQAGLLAGLRHIVDQTGIASDAAPLFFEEK